MKRRDFLKDAAIGAGALALAGCGSGTLRGRKARGAGSNAEDGTAANSPQMEIRTNPANGDRVSLLGFGCMRWPM
ncbi:MAG: twin-arginine translocation signal domain-containing protein, partial [Bacteroidales bacterium]|nr:twin-arginine translocation signal domain-containing protein [Bacteroidales bacterium]